MKYILSIILMFTSLCSTAQVYSSEACFYLRAGKDMNDSGSHWIVVSFRGNKAVLNNDGTSLWKIKKDLKKNENYYEDVEIQDRINGFIYTYDPSMSTSSRYVYKRCFAAKRPDHPFDNSGHPAFCDYLAFSKDNSSLIRWREYDDEIRQKFEFVRVPKSEVLPQGINRDFLE